MEYVREYQGRRDQIGPGPEVLGAPEIFLLGPSLFCVLNISAQRTRYFGFLPKKLSTGGGGCSPKNFFPEKKILNRGP
jgi:hypothetical protein